MTVGRLKEESGALNWAFWEMIENKYWHYCPSHCHTFSLSSMFTSPSPQPMSDMVSAKVQYLYKRTAHQVVCPCGGYWTSCNPGMPYSICWAILMRRLLSLFRWCLRLRLSGCWMTVAYLVLWRGCGCLELLNWKMNWNGGIDDGIKKPLRSLFHSNTGL